jgi:glutamyl-tRNA reductase
MNVASSLDSMVVGESQILGQTKEAFLVASEAGATGKYLNRLFHQAFHAAKRVHGATDIGRRHTSVASVAVDFASRIFSGLESKRVLLVGAGEMAQRAAEHLRSVGCGQVTVVNRSADRAAELAARVEAQVRPWDQLDEALVDSDIAISSTASDQPILSRDRVATAQKRRRWANWLLVDLAVPRDIDPAAAKIDNLYLYDMDALGRVVSENLALRQQEAETAGEIVADEVRAYLDWFEVRDVGPVVARLEARLHELGDEELERLLKRLGDDVTESARNEIRLATHRIVHKLLHEPIEQLKADARHGRQGTTLSALKRLFRLDDRSDS